MMSKAFEAFVVLLWLWTLVVRAPHISVTNETLGVSRLVNLCTLVNDIWFLIMYVNNTTHLTLGAYDGNLGSSNNSF